MLENYFYDALASTFANSFVHFKSFFIDIPSFYPGTCRYYTVRQYLLYLPKILVGR